jgi:hypothetical protein
VGVSYSFGKEPKYGWSGRGLFIWQIAKLGMGWAWLIQLAKSQIRDGVGVVYSIGKEPN